MEWPTVKPLALQLKEIHELTGEEGVSVQLRVHSSGGWVIGVGARFVDVVHALPKGTLIADALLPSKYEPISYVSYAIELLEQVENQRAELKAQEQRLEAVAIARSLL